MKCIWRKLVHIYDFILEGVNATLTDNLLFYSISSLVLHKCNVKLFTVIITKGYFLFLRSNGVWLFSFICVFGFILVYTFKIFFVLFQVKLIKPCLIHGTRITISTLGSNSKVTQTLKGIIVISHLDDHGDEVRELKRQILTVKGRRSLKAITKFLII